MERVIILGNNGSGKTDLARKMSGCLNLDVIHLDKFYWGPGGFRREWPESIVNVEIDRLAQANAWIVEGVFGELAQRFFLRADYLIWLDMNWATCMARLHTHHSENFDGPGRGETTEGFTELLKWASGYSQRLGPTSYKGHQQLYGEFTCKKIHLTSSRAVENFLDTIPQVSIFV